MIEVLFRGFHPDKNSKVQVFVNGEWINGFWVYGNLFVQSSNECLIIPLGENFFSAKAYAVIPETVGQYTGLTDKNGTKIFEHDILFADKHGFTGVVEYNSVIASFMIRINDSTENYYHYSHFNEDNPARKEQLQYTAIIGNVHDNPELLEV